MYEESIKDIKNDKRFNLIQTPIGLDVVSRKMFRKNDILYVPKKIIKVPNDLKSKYGAFIWHDDFIMSGFGMLLNNGDSGNKNNCLYDKDKGFIASKNIYPNDSIRIDYKMNTDEYPTIPQEIIHLRSTMVV